MCFLHHLKVRLNDNARLLLPRGATLSAAGLLVSSGSEVGCDDDIYINKKGLTLTLLSSSLEVGCVADLFSPYIYIYIYMYIYMSTHIRGILITIIDPIISKIQDQP